MKLFNILVIGFMLLASHQTYSQAIGMDKGGLIYLNPNSSGDNSDNLKRGYYVGPHPLGEDITRKLNDFEEAYVYFEESGGAYSVEQKKYNKPVLYRSIKKLSKGLL